MAIEFGCTPSYESRDCVDGRILACLGKSLDDLQQFVTSHGIDSRVRFTLLEYQLNGALDDLIDFGRRCADKNAAITDFRQ